MHKLHIHIQKHMPKAMLLSLFILCYWDQLSAQCNFSISGTINEEHTNETLDFASLQILELNVVRTTDSAGNFQFNNLCKGTYTLAYTHPGCKTEYQKINLEKSETLQLHLHHNEIDLNEVTIAQHKRESAPTQQVETLKDQTLFETRGMTFRRCIENIIGGKHSQNRSYYCKAGNSWHDRQSNSVGE
jgi:iron complex outermembrane receptor protein